MSNKLRYLPSKIHFLKFKICEYHLYNQDNNILDKFDLTHVWYFGSDYIFLYITFTLGWVTIWFYGCPTCHPSINSGNTPMTLSNCSYLVAIDTWNTPPLYRLFDMFLLWNTIPHIYDNAYISVIWKYNMRTQYID